MDRDFPSGDVEGDSLFPSPDSYLDLGTCWALHPADHTVLRKADTGDDFVINLEDSVSLEESGFL